MKSQFFKNIVLTDKKKESVVVQKQLLLFCIAYLLISIAVRYLIRDVLFRAGIYEEWFVDATTIGPLIQGLLAVIGMVCYTSYYGEYKWSLPEVFKTALFLGVLLSFFRWFIILILGGGILVLLDLQDHGVVQNYVESHFIVDIGALLIDVIMLRYLYQSSLKKYG